MTAWDAVEAVLCRHHYKPDLDAARVVYSTVATHGLTDSVPVWVMHIAPPGTMKTELLEALKGLPAIYLIDEVTPKTFLSMQIDDDHRRGKKQKRTESPSLLHRIGKSGIIAFPDFSTILSMNKDHRGQVFAAMRRICDGMYHREVGHAERLSEREWTGRITFCTACTPDVDHYRSAFQSLGERFLSVRSPRADGPKAAKAAMRQNKQKLMADLKRVVKLLFASLPDTSPLISEEHEDQIANLAELTVRARTSVYRSRNRKMIENLPEAESATRLSQQLCQLAKGSALVGGHDAVGEEDMRIIRRAALDCLPTLRKKILCSLLRGDLFADIQMPLSTRRYAGEDLEALGLLKNDRCFTRSAMQLIENSRVYTCIETA
jgi:hypothetical protein